MSKKTKIILVVIIFLVLGGASFWVVNWYYGWYKIGADAIIGCQAPGMIKNFMGKAGSNLVTYSLFGQDVSVNEKIIRDLDSVQRDVAAAKTGYSFDNVQTYNYRSKRGGGGLSLHSFGIAIDINPDRNPYQIGNWGDPQTDIPRAIIDIFEAHGFQWGGDWKGQEDPMHFEWYGSEVSGSFVNAANGQKITTEITAKVNGESYAVNDGSYNWVLPATHPSAVDATAKGYDENKFDMELFCFQTRQMDISLKPLPDNLGGSISGKVVVSGTRPLIPATIYLDGKAIGSSNIAGDYLVSDVKKGVHKVEARILFFPGNAVTTPAMVPGENIQNFNITIGK